jgi:hypothetical protein
MAQVADGQCYVAATGDERAVQTASRSDWNIQLVIRMLKFTNTKYNAGSHHQSNHRPLMQPMYLLTTNIM